MLFQFENTEEAETLINGLHEKALRYEEEKAEETAKGADREGGSRKDENLAYKVSEMTYKEDYRELIEDLYKEVTG